MFRSPRLPSILGIYSLSVSLCRWYILFIVIIFCVFLSMTFSSPFFHFSIPALYLTKDTACILTVFPPFNFDDVSCLTLLYYSFLILSFISVCIMSLANKIIIIITILLLLLLFFCVCICVCLNYYYACDCFVINVNVYY